MRLRKLAFRRCYTALPFTKGLPAQGAALQRRSEKFTCTSLRWNVVEAPASFDLSKAAVRLQDDCIAAN